MFVRDAVLLLPKRCTTSCTVSHEAFIVQLPAKLEPYGIKVKSSFIEKKPCLARHGYNQAMIVIIQANKSLKCN